MKQQHWQVLASCMFGFSFAAPALAEGMLQMRANGEDFVRQGFVSKDGWRIDFEHVYVHLTDVVAYQTDPPFDPEAEGRLQAKSQVDLVKSQTVDLAAGDENAEPILVAEMVAPSGRYNALAWKMTPASAGPAQGQTLMLVGTAAKADQSIPFTLNIDQEYAYSCGDFVGEDRKGILEAGGLADLEATFHFDHIFGDAETAADDALNLGAVGFEPFAALATGDNLTADMATLKTKLSGENYQKLAVALASLGHVGEGHCQETLANL
ncbi:MAG: DUF4382 domain-containing protein [Cyanobacteriota bacterium]|nr:DUF4382 domain-containing protein [Cyanobacteriota bacterium]